MLSTIDGQRLRFRLRTHGTTSTLIGTGAISAGQWTHAAATYDGAAVGVQQDGVEVGSFSLNIPPGQWRQDGEPFRRRFGMNNLAAAYVKVRVISGSGIVAYASVVDNRTNDATTFPMKK